MRFNGKELAAVALQPAHKFDKEGVLMIKEKQDGLFRRGEVYVPRFCRLRGNLLFYFKSADLCSEPVGVFVLEQCTVSLESNNLEGPYAFNLSFEGDKGIQKFLTNTELERDSWIQVLHMASYQYMCSQLRALQEKLNNFQPVNDMVDTHARLSRTRSMLDSSDEPFLEMSLSCDNLLCDGNGTAPNPMLNIAIMTPPETQWSFYAQTEILERCSNPCFLTTIGFRSSDNVTPISRVKISAYDVRERLTLTMTLLGSTVFTIGKLMDADKNKLRLTLISVDNMTVGFVSVTAWQIESESASSANASSSNQGSPQDEQVPSEKARSLTLPAKLPCKSRISQHNQLNVLYDNAISQTYRFHTGLGADLSVLEIMAENKLSFTFPQSLLLCFIKEEKDILSNMALLGELKPVWNERQIEEIDRHLQLINSYTQALTYLDSYRGPYFKASALKADVNMEFVPVNLHLQRMWIQNDSTKKCGIHDVITVGAFAAHTFKYKSGGLLKLIAQCSKLSRFNGTVTKSNNNNNNGHQPNKLEQSMTISNKIRDMRQDLKCLLDRLNSLAQRKSTSEMQLVMTDVANLANQLTKVCEPSLIEEAYHALEEARVPENNNKTQDTLARNCLDRVITLSPARLLSSSPSPVHLTSMHSEDDNSSVNNNEKSDSSKEWPIRRIQHRRSASDARLYAGFDTESIDADRHSLFNIRITEEPDGRPSGKICNPPSSPTPTLTRKLGWKLNRQSKEETNCVESNSMLSLFRRGGIRSRHERSMINIGQSEGSDSNKEEEMQTLGKCKKTLSLRSLNGARIRSCSPDEPEPWDLTQLNIEASVMCMASKVKALCCRRDHGVTMGGVGIAGGADPQPSDVSSAIAAPTQLDWVEELRPSVKKLKQALDCLLKTSRLTHCLFSLQESSECLALQSVIQYRRDIVVTQALTALVSALLTKLWCHRPEPVFLARLSQLGILAEFEGLLSCYGDEMGMLDDMVVAIDDLRQVRFKLVKCENSAKIAPQVEGTRTNLIVNLPVPDVVLTLLPMECKESCEFLVTPVFFNVGINEQATFAEKFGDVTLQDKINMDGADRLKDFYNKYEALPIKVGNNKKHHYSEYHSTTDSLINKLSTLVKLRRSKNVEILRVAAQICRQLDGVRFISCKSAKDRTSMAVTLEQCVIMEEEYDLAEPEFNHALDCMRCEGTRRENTLKNAGVMKYAFNSLQLMALPKLYRPPPGTYGNVQT